MLSAESHRENREANGQESYGRFLYNRFRYYDPAVGRYVAPDPIGQRGGVNLFLYAGIDPVQNSDSLGLDPFYKLREAVGRVQDAAANLPGSAEEAIDQVADALAGDNLSEDPDDTIGKLRAASDKAAALADACDALVAAGDEPATNDGLSKAGRALDKKQGQAEASGTTNAFPAPRGNPAAKSEQGRSVVREIATDPGSTISPTSDGGVDITDSSGRTMRYSRDGGFVGFRQPR